MYETERRTYTILKFSNFLKNPIMLFQESCYSNYFEIAAIAGCGVAVCCCIVELHYNQAEGGVGIGVAEEEGGIEAAEEEDDTEVVEEESVSCIDHCSLESICNPVAGHPRRMSLAVCIEIPAPVIIAEAGQVEMDPVLELVVVERAPMVDGIVARVSVAVSEVVVLGSLYESDPIASSRGYGLKIFSTIYEEYQCIHESSLKELFLC